MTIIATRGSRQVRADFDGSTWDNWQTTSKTGKVLAWSRPGDRKDHVDATLVDFFRGARDGDFETYGYIPTRAGRAASKTSCNCNPGGETPAWRPEKIKGARERAPNRGGRDSSEWKKYLYELGKALNPTYAELEEPLSFKGLQSMAEVAHALAVAKADLALVHAHQEEDRQRQLRAAAQERRLARLRGEEVHAPPRPAKQTHEVTLAKRRARDAVRRAEERAAEAQAQAKRDKKRDAARVRRAAKKGTGE